ncbi:Lrp/AsnC family transcriptional regulator [Pseudoduganella aquatica]|jgi:DNA-binding Lrp family transcriptional regulator|uniref:Winged helix-turn-helix transcriptional regulator n=1 Tax=Pseudoduganella aquatica TaxID=2660641 RepID=A0A7X4KL26_9BURK|nr:Lrp/AsnC family transcriptional regulator [Pseudoduganella aquatica]MYN07734.1 winged helix-turn-helix transcriptional regulator [Pseudoduganella aquatica]
MKNDSLDAASVKILSELQKNGRISSNELAEKIGMSASPCWRRQKELEDNGYIIRYTALVDRRKLGLSVVCMAHITLARHEEGVVKNFEEAMRLRPEVVECYETTGNADYLVKIVVADMDGYHDFLHNVLVKLNGVSQVNTSVALREVKYETALPL